MTRQEFNAEMAALRSKLRAVPAQLRRAHHQMCARELERAKLFQDKNEFVATAALQAARHHAQFV